MNVRNLLAAGDFVIPVPAGLPITVQYDEAGHIQLLLLGRDSSGVAVDDSVFQALLTTDIVPRIISVTGGTTWVSGIFTCTDIRITVPGCIPDDMLNEYLLLLKESPAQFSFHALSVKSNAIQFVGGMASQKWLASSGFSTLPNYVVPAQLPDSQIHRMLESVNTPVGMYVMRRGVWSYQSLEIYQDVVSTVSKKFDNIGLLKGLITFTSGNRLIVDYFDVVSHNIQPNSLVIYAGSEVRDCVQLDTKTREPRAARFNCPICGSTIQVSNRDTMCSNLHCGSRYLESIKHFLITLGAPVAEDSMYLSDITGDVTYVKVLDLPVYADFVAKVTLTTLLRAAIPLTMLRSDSIISDFCTACTNSIESIQYYLKHLDRLASDTGCDPYIGNAMNTITYDTVLVDDIIALMHNSHIEVQKTDIKFDGPDIFRGRVICITGSFRRGTMEEIASIIRSYGANVIMDPTLEFDCLVVGDMQENTRGDAIRKARESNIPVFTESGFFVQYQIDDDISIM